MSGTYSGPTPEAELLHMEKEQATTRHFFGGTSTYNIRFERAFKAIIAVKDPYDATPDAYDYYTGYGRTLDAAYQQAHAQAYEADW